MNVEDEKLVKRLIAHQATIPTAGFTGTYAAYPKGNIRRKPVCWIEHDTLHRLMNDRVLERDGPCIQVSGNVIHLFGDRPKRLTDQRQAQEHREIFNPDGVIRKTSHRLTTLEQIARKRRASGATYLNKAQVEAGQQFAKDYMLAGLSHVTTQNYDYLPGGNDNAAETAMVSRLDRRRRVNEAISCLGPGLERAAVCICCEDWSLIQLEQSENWVKGAGANILKLALDRLVKFYGTEPGGSKN